jgi:hypothetical protein
MPNDIENILTLHTNAEELNQIVGKEFSFKHVVPEPTDNMDYFGDGWYIESWGTKWDAYEIEEISKEEDENGKITIKYMFNTAWSPPIPWFKSVANKFKNTELTLYWSDEDVPVSGWIKYFNGILYEENFEYYNTESALHP